MKKKVAVIMGSKSDLEKVKSAFRTLDELQIPYEAHILSAHRTPEKVFEFAKNAHKNNFAVIISAAGMAAHLGGVIASATVLPVIAVPMSSGKFDGLDALLSAVQMPPGIPVATVAIDATKNAALLAAQILAINDEEVFNRLKLNRESMAKEVLKSDEMLNNQLNQDKTK